MKSNLVKRGFVSLLVAQFFGAANDNVLKQILVFMVGTGLWAGVFGEGGPGIIGLCLTVPFILLSGIAGQIADRLSKRTVMVAAKAAEIPIALLAGIGLLLGNLWFTMGAFVVLAIQSSFFGPAKYGVIPELVEDTDLSRANGTINMLTNVAVILGTIIGGPLADVYFPKADPGGGLLWAPAVVLIGLATLGFFSIIWMPKVPAADPDLVFDWNPFGTYVTSIKEMCRGPLINVAFAWSYFYLVGMISILALAKYDQVLNVSYTQAAYLLGTLGISIGIGSALCGLLSGHHIRPGFVPIGGVGITIAFFALGLIPPTFWNVAALLCVSGTFAGFYIVPLQALLQKLSPDNERGRFLGTANALSFCFSSLGSLVFFVCAGPLKIPTNRIFLVCGALMLGWMIYSFIKLGRFVREHPTM